MQIEFVVDTRKNKIQKYIAAITRVMRYRPTVYINMSQGDVLLNSNNLELIVNDSNKNITLSFFMKNAYGEKLNEVIEHYRDFLANAGSIQKNNKSDYKVEVIEKSNIISVTFQKDNIDSLDIQAYEVFVEKNSYHEDYVDKVFFILKQLFSVEEVKSQYNDEKIILFNNYEEIDFAFKILVGMNLSLSGSASELNKLTFKMTNESRNFNCDYLYSLFLRSASVNQIQQAICKLLKSNYCDDNTFFNLLLEFVKSKPNLSLLNYLLSISKNSDLVFDDRFVSLVLASMESSFLSVKKEISSIEEISSREKIEINKTIVKINNIENKKNYIQTVYNQSNPAVWLTLRNCFKNRPDFNDQASMAKAIGRYVDEIFNNSDLPFEKKYIELSRLADFLKLCIDHPEWVPYFKNKSSEAFQSALNKLRQTAMNLIRGKIENLPKIQNMKDDLIYSNELIYMRYFLDSVKNHPLFSMHSSDATLLLFKKTTNSFDELNRISNEFKSRIDSIKKRFNDSKFKFVVLARSITSLMYEEFKKDDSMKAFLRLLLMHYIKLGSFPMDEKGRKILIDEHKNFIEDKLVSMRERMGLKANKSHKSIEEYLSLPEVSIISNFLLKITLGRSIKEIENMKLDDKAAPANLDPNGLRKEDPLVILKTQILTILQKNHLNMSIEESDDLAIKTLLIIDDIDKVRKEIRSKFNEPSENTNLDEDTSRLVYGKINMRKEESGSSKEILSTEESDDPSKKILSIIDNIQKVQNEMHMMFRAASENTNLNDQTRHSVYERKGLN